MSPLRHRSVFGAKSAKQPTPKSSFFRVRRQNWCLSLQIRSVSAENRLQTFRAQNSVFCPEKPANSSPPSSSPLVTALSPLASGARKCAKAAQFRGLRSSQGFPRPDSPLRTWLGARQPAEVSACGPSVRELVTTDVTAPSGSVFGAKKRSKRSTPKSPFFVSARFRSKAGHFAQDSAFSPENRRIPSRRACHRLSPFVTASSPLSLGPKSAQKRPSSGSSSTMQPGDSSMAHEWARLVH